MSVELCNESVSISSVNHTSVLDTLASGSRAAKAVHTDLKEEFCGCGIGVKNVTDKSLFCDLHNYILSERMKIKRPKNLMYILYT